MKIDILIVDFVVVASVIIPYLILVIIGFNESKIQKKKFLEEAIKYQLKPGEIDGWNLNTIGIDRNLQKVLFIQRTKALDRVELIDLKNIRKSEIVSTTKPIKINDKVEEVLQRIDLELEYSHSGEKKLINLYDCDVTYSEEYEMDHAKKWNQIINSVLSYNPILDSAA